MSIAAEGEVRPNTKQGDGSDEEEDEEEEEEEEEEEGVSRILKVKYNISVDSCWSDHLATSPWNLCKKTKTKTKQKNK